jgi:hypothetical protein
MRFDHSHEPLLWVVSFARRHPAVLPEPIAQLVSRTATDGHELIDNVVQIIVDDLRLAASLPTG